MTSRAAIADRYAFPALLLVLTLLFCSGIVSIRLDPPFGLATYSRALYADEGFYVDAARNLVQFGRWSLPYDFDHWPGAPMLNVILAAVFGLFGASLESARISSMIFSFASCLIFYNLCRTVFDRLPSAALTLAAASTLNFIAFARSTLADPTATFFSLSALLIYVRFTNRLWAIPASLTLALVAHLTKSYFITALIAIVVLWIFELAIRLHHYKWQFRRTDIVIFGASLFLLTGMYLCYLWHFWVPISYWTHVTVGPKAGDFNAFEIIWNYLRQLRSLPFYTKTHIFIASSIICTLIIVMTAELRAKLRGIINRTDLAIIVWLTLGLALVGSLDQQRPRYLFFAILLLCYIGARVAQIVAPGRHKNTVIVALAIAHIAIQAPFYYFWLTRDQNTAQYDMGVRMANLIDQRDNARLVPVIGEMAAFVALFSSRIHSLDAKWVAPDYSLCDRIGRWRPRFHVNLVWPGSETHHELAMVTACEPVTGATEIERIVTFRPWHDEAVLSELHYGVNEPDEPSR